MQNEARVQPESVISMIESVADPALAEEWDPSGVQVAATRRKIFRLAVALDPTPDVLGRAIAWEADLILTHHPLSLHPTLPFRLDDYHTALRLLLGRDIWLYSAHTSLDLATSGPVSWLARSLRLSNIGPVAELPHSRAGNSAHSPAGYGVQGACPAPLSWSRFTRELARITGLNCWRRTGEPPEEITRIAYCPGSGMSLARTAFDNGADVFLSGDLKYHTAQDIESRGPTLDLGHFILEEHMMRTWAADLEAALCEHSVDVAFFPGHDPIACETNQ
jgi:dinuclear metal center YbgI/SA1388 family protein